MKVLSLGAGVQSTTVLRMSIAGELDRIDHAIFADTGWEPPEVYIHLKELRVEAEGAGIPVHVVRATPEGLRADVMAAQGPGHRKWFATLPLYVLGPDGARGMGRRQCTREYKITPIERKIRELLGLRPRRWAPIGAVEHWFGISADEARRMRVSRHRWATNYYPLVDLNMTRADCLRWHDARGLPHPPRSACIGCPYHDNAEWSEIKARPDLWADVVEFDQAIRRKAGPRGEQYLHADRVPIDQVDFRTAEEAGQEVLDFGNFRDECAGMCGV